ncbi:hypothetical protein FACS189437_02430 [Bacteroidia bacterium]|nr:hypothetical protein FACS189437_02430 [Bacteroidia bacterium]
MIYLRSNNQFSLKRKLMIDLNLLFRKPAHSFKIFGNQFNLEYGLSKNFFGNKLSIQILHHIEFMKWTQLMDYSYKYIDFSFDASNRNQLSINLKYNFNSPKKTIKEKSSNSEELKRM